MDDHSQKIKEDIKEWFLRRYEDPCESTPYDSSEGGYLYQWGGPYDAREVLFRQFSKEVDENVLNKAADELESLCPEWERIPTLEDIDPYCIASEYLARFEKSVVSIRSELERPREEAIDSFMCALLFAHTVTCLEAYLADAFLTCIKTPKFFRAFIESDPELSKEKIVISEIYKKMESLQGDVTEKIRSVVFHRLPIVRNMYKDTLGIIFPHGIKELMAAIEKRHDIVHRDCKCKDGNTFQVTKSEVVHLIERVEKFVTELDVLVEERLQ